MRWLGDEWTLYESWCEFHSDRPRLCVRVRWRNRGCDSGTNISRRVLRISQVYDWALIDSNRG